jgi:hypothetical protein
MDLNTLYNKLILAARAARPSEEVPYAFEKRIMARLMPRLKVDPWALWSRNLSRSAVLCGIVCLLVGLWSYHKFSRDTVADSISVAFETAVFAPQDQGNGDGW